MHTSPDFAPADTVQATMWLEGRRVVFTIAILDTAERDRVAAAIANLAMALAEPHLNTVAWQAFIDDVLERYVDIRVEGEDVCRFVGAVAVLARDGVYLAFVRSAERHRASEAALRESRIRFNASRDAARFPTLDDALDAAETMKRRWLRRGWIESPADGDGDR